MSIKTTLQHIIAWIEKEFSIVELKIAPVAVGILEGVKTALDNGTLNFLADAVTAMTGSAIPGEVIAIVKNQLPRALASALALEALTPNPTEAQILAFEQQVIAAYNLPSTNKSKVATLVAADLFQELKAFAASDQQVTFAIAVGEVEKCFQIMKSDLSA